MCDTIRNENYARYGDSRPYERESDGASPAFTRSDSRGPFLLDETVRALRYPRLQNLYKLSPEDIDEHIQRLRGRADLVTPVVYKPIVLADPNDDPVVYTAVAGGTDVLCALDRDFYAAEVIAFCRNRGIEVMNDVDLLRLLSAKKPGET